MRGRAFFFLSIYLWILKEVFLKSVFFYLTDKGLDQQTTSSVSMQYSLGQTEVIKKTWHLNLNRDCWLHYGRVGRVSQDAVSLTRDTHKPTFWFRVSTIKRPIDWLIDWFVPRVCTPYFVPLLISPINSRRIKKERVNVRLQCTVAAVRSSTCTVLPVQTS